MRKLRAATWVGLAVLALVVAGTASAKTWKAQPNEYVVVYQDGVPLAQARLAIRQAGGLLVHENAKIGVSTVYSANPLFLAEVMRSPALAGAARSRPVGKATSVKPRPDLVERLTDAERASVKASASRDAPAVGAEPLSRLQWDMAMIHATVDGSYAIQQGDPRVRIGIIDTGIEASNPDLAPNFNAAVSRNFTTDIPAVDGPCEVPSCQDPANVDDNGHGTHVAGTVGAALNGLGIAGVAPRVTLLNLRAGQDSGYFFLQPTVDALTYAGDNSVDVVNMSYYIDPWLFNCVNSPEDSLQARMEQGTIILATTRALRYAYNHGVTLVAALGNGHSDKDNPTIDTSSPDYPPGSEYLRHVNNTCLDLPTEGENVISVISVGPSTMKADYSDYSIDGAVVAAPGGYFRDYPGTPLSRRAENLILSTYSERLARLNGDLNPDGTPNTPFVLRDCQSGTCAYYQYLQGTSMASPHAVGVAAVIVSQWGSLQGADGGLGLRPFWTEWGLTTRAVDHPCPVPPLIDYGPAGRPDSYDALCQGSAEKNNIWGDGIVDAMRVLRR
ncbi:MAG: S8 family serine peptidase [Actinobacteria bacterium]|nr:S8 family serine peptidase [Actinomycetota bacterium]